MNRQEIFVLMSRTKPQRSADKKLLGKPKGKLELIDFNQYPALDWMTRAYRNNRYVVMTAWP